MSEPTQEILRRGQVMSWLEPLGVSPRKTKYLIKLGVIKAEHFDLGKKELANRKQQKNGNRNGHNGGGDARAHFRKSQIKAALNL